MKSLPLFLFVGLFLLRSPSLQAEPEEARFSFASIADCQYCNVEGKGVRKYSVSDKKLRSCVEHLNTLELSFVIHLGDFIDKDFESFDVVGPIFDDLKAPHHHVLGNHDFSVADDKKRMVPAKLGLENRYYMFQRKGWRFLALDGNDVSFHAWPKGSPEYKFAAQYYAEKEIKGPKWNGGLGAEQLDWLKSHLIEAESAQEKVILFCHFPVFPANAHNLWNAEEVVQLLEQYDCVKAYLNGHNHAGNYAEKNGIHYLTFKGMVDTVETSYSVIDVFGDRLESVGFGREPNRNMPLR